MTIKIKIIGKKGVGKSNIALAIRELIRTK